ncbi:dTDP-4-amino-4,6-dideoxygalactose transaminase [Rhizobiales bacterium GAS113]|nr:dTDP-4-amino-4,6-dideoxygalactose transaminase [Rhizobiales bacterium GAS113]
MVFIFSRDQIEIVPADHSQLIAGRADVRPSQPIVAPAAPAIPFNRPTLAGNEFAYLREALDNQHLSGNGPFTKKCHAWLERAIGCEQALLTHSCTAAMEMAAMLFDLRPGDEVIMPSFTFVSTANAAVLRGAVPVFVDIRPDTLNIDERLIEAAITGKTKAIFVVHYAGVGCAMDDIMAIAQRHGLFVLEDAAQGVSASYEGRPLGGIGHLGALSFHETKNLISGEGGALLVNDKRFLDRAHVLWEKGTNRTAFFEGRVDKYTWVDFGSSYLPSELIAAFLYAQLERADEISDKRQRSWLLYHRKVAHLEEVGFLRRPIIPQSCSANHHIYYVLMRTAAARSELLRRTKDAGIGVTFHYVPLHSSPAGRRFARTHGELRVTDDASARLVRLPLWPGIPDDAIETVVNIVADVARSC